MKATNVILLMAVMAMVGCGRSEEKRAKAPVRVKTEQAFGGADAADGPAFVGIVEEHESTAVSFTGMGLVRRVLVSEGQTVSRGQLLAEMDDTQARNVLAGAEAQMTQADDALQRYRQLHDSGSITEAQWVEVQSKVAQARSALEVARKNVADCRLKAPVGGIIGRKMIGSGETALPSQAVVTILDVTSVKVKVSVPEAEIGRIGEHTPTYIRVDAIGRSFEGGRIEKGIVADAMTHTYDVRIHVANADRSLLPGMVASVRIGGIGTGTLHAGNCLLPVSAVQRRADGTLFVWTVGADSTAHRTAVSIGATRGNRVAVDGLTGREAVVVEGYQKLSEGTKVVY